MYIIFSLPTPSALSRLRLSIAGRTRDSIFWPVLSLGSGRTDWSKRLWPHRLNPESDASGQAGNLSSYQSSKPLHHHLLSTCCRSWPYLCPYSLPLKRAFPISLGSTWRVFSSKLPSCPWPFALALLTHRFRLFIIPVPTILSSVFSSPSQNQPEYLILQSKIKSVGPFKHKYNRYSYSYRDRMRTNQKILIKDPYMNSTFKSEARPSSPYLSVPRAEQSREYADNSKWKIQQDMRRELERTQNQFKRMAKAYTEENRLNKKILDYQAVNHEYHQALKLRNFDLNTRLADVATQNHLLSNKFQGDIMRNFHEKDLLIKKYETQAEQLLQARKTINNLLQLKTKMQQELQHMSFLLQRQTDRFNLQMKEQILRMEGLQRSIKNVTEVKDQEIGQLRNRIRIYQDQNKRLGDQNRSLHILNQSQKERERERGKGDRDKENRGGIDNLSQIHHLDSQSKDPLITQQLQQQRHINQKLQRELDDLKRKLFHSETHEVNPKSPQKPSVNNAQDLGNMDKVDGIINSVNTLRNGINKEVFDVFYKSVKDGEKHRSNSLVIFIENWKNIDLERLYPYIKSYFQSRDSLKQLCLSQKYKGKPIQTRMQQCIPLHIALKKGRNEINTWILSTIQFTKNQRESSKKNMNNLLLFLFRLLTILYRITYPMQGKSYVIDGDVRNELAHQIVKAIDYIVQFK